MAPILIQPGNDFATGAELEELADSEDVVLMNPSRSNPLASHEQACICQLFCGKFCGAAGQLPTAG